MHIYDTIRDHCIVAIEYIDEGVCAIGCLKCGWADIVPLQEYRDAAQRLRDSGAIVHDWSDAEVQELLHDS